MMTLLSAPCAPCAKPPQPIHRSGQPFDPAGPLVHPAGAATAANDLVQAIRQRTPGWAERVENSSWVTEDPDPDEHGVRWIVTSR